MSTELDPMTTGANAYNPVTATGRTRNGGPNITTLLATYDNESAVATLQEAYVAQISSHTGRFPCKVKKYGIVVNMPKANFILLTPEETAAHILTLATETEQPSTETQEPTTQDVNETGANASTPAKATYYTRIVPIENEFQDTVVSTTWATEVLTLSTTFNTSTAIMGLHNLGFAFRNEGKPWSPVANTEALQTAVEATTEQHTEDNNPEVRTAASDNTQFEEAPQRGRRHTEAVPA